jgi:Rad3-related DNA helicase
VRKKQDIQKTTKQLLDNFPTGYTPTDSQVVALKQIQTALDSDIPFVIICASTGAGKSLYAKTLSNTTNDPIPQALEMIRDYSVYKTDEFGNYVNADDYLLYPRFGGFALTISKQLQAQYLELFKDTKIMMGKSNYQCQIDLNYDVETAPCIFLPKLKHKCWEENKCLYYNARNDALCSKFSALNYKMFLSLPDHLKYRNILICDEASELEEELVKVFSCNIQYSVLKYVGINVRPLVTDMPGRVASWISEVLDHASSALEQIKSKKTDKLSDSDKIKMKVLFNLKAQLSTVSEHFHESEYVVEKDIKKVTLTPLKVDKLSRHIFDYADKVVLMSATIIDPHHFAKILGIKKFEYIEVSSTFDPKKSPICVSNKVSLNYKNLNQNLPIIAEQIEKILAHHKDEKGIIHTHTNNITQQLKKLLKNNANYHRLLFREDGSTNKDILNEHTTSKEATVLVSPSLKFGVDLLDHLGRFSIICKAPFPPLMDKRIAMLYKEDQQGYIDVMLKAVIQMCGRCTRSVDDYSTTYILDGNIGRVIVDNKEKLPKSFILRFT